MILVIFGLRKMDTKRLVKLIVFLLVILIFFFGFMTVLLAKEEFPHSFYIDYHFDFNDPEINISILIIGRDFNVSYPIPFNISESNNKKYPYDYIGSINLNLTRGSFVIKQLISSKKQNISEDPPSSIVLKRPLDCSERIEYYIENSNLFVREITRFRNIGFVPINISGSYDSNFIKIKHLNGTIINDLLIILESGKEERGYIIEGVFPIYNLNKNETDHYISFSFNRKSIEENENIELKIPEVIDRFCDSLQPFTVTLSLPRKDGLFKTLKINYVESVPDYMYEDESNRILVWRRDELIKESETIHINFNYSVDWSIIIIGGIGIFAGIIIDWFLTKLKGFKRIKEAFKKIIKDK